MLDRTTPRHSRLELGDEWATLDRTYFRDQVGEALMTFFRPWTAWDRRDDEKSQRD